MDQLESLFELLQPWLPLLTISGLVMAIASAVALPWLLVRLPEDYFVSVKKTQPDRSPFGWLVWLLRNTLAIVLFIAGLLMLVLPGQGLLMILISLGVSTLYHKYSLERAIIRRKPVFDTVNWIRKRYHRRPMIHPDSTTQRSRSSD